MADWRTIAEEKYDDSYSYHIYHDPEYAEMMHPADAKSFQIWATKGTQKYIHVDRVIDPADEEEVNAMLAEATAYVPLYLYAHSGVSVSTIPFGDPWDSGQCGFAVMTNPDEYGISVDAMSHDWNATLNGLVKYYDNVLRGNIISWSVTKTKKCDHCGESKSEVVDGVSGYVGYDFKEIDALVHEEIIPTIQALVKADKEAEHGPDSVNRGDD